MFHPHRCDWDPSNLSCDHCEQVPARTRASLLSSGEGECPHDVSSELAVVGRTVPNRDKADPRGDKILKVLALEWAPALETGAFIRRCVLVLA